ncbi:OTU domain-containing protein [Glycine soja]|nr:OTU domain-containing protein [Glycine soja]
MATHEMDPDVVRWGLHLLDVCTLSHHGSPSIVTQYDPDLSRVEYVTEGFCQHEYVDNDEAVARAYQEELSQLDSMGASGISNFENEGMQGSVYTQDWPQSSNGNYNFGNESCQNSVDESYNMKEVENYGPTPSERENGMHENDVYGSSSGSVEVPVISDDFWDSLEISDESSLDGEVGKRLNQMVPIPTRVINHVLSRHNSGVADQSAPSLLRHLLHSSWMLWPSLQKITAICSFAAAPLFAPSLDRLCDLCHHRTAFCSATFLELPVRQIGWVKRRGTADGGKRLALCRYPLLTSVYKTEHVPKTNEKIPSDDEEISDHQRLLDRLQLYDLIECKVQGDGNCQFRSLSDQLYRSPDHHKFVRQQIVQQLKSYPDLYAGYVPMAYIDYLKNMSKSGEWGDHVTLQAAADWYGVKIFVITSFKDTCYIEILPQIQKSGRVIFLSFWAEVHYNSIYPEGELPSSHTKKKKKWWNFGG